MHHILHKWILVQRRRRLALRTTALSGVLAVLNGCASLDPSNEIAQAQSLVGSRIGNQPDWSTAWDVPASFWNGQDDLSAEQAVRTALQNNREIRALVATIAEYRADFVQAHLLPNPVLSFAFGFPTDGLGGQPLAATAMQQLTWLWRRPTEIDAATEQLRAQVLTVSDAALRLVEQVQAAHARCVLGERALQLQEENVSLIQQSLALVDNRLAVGEANQLDFNRLELDLLAAESVKDDRHAALETAQRELLLLMALPDASTAWRSDGELPDYDELLQSAQEQWMIDLVQQQRLDVAAASALVAGRTEQVELAELGRLPNVGAGAGYQEMFDGRRGVFPGVEVTPKLLDDNSAAVAKAAARLEQARIEADRIRQAAITEARTAWVRVQNQRRVIQRYEQSILSLAEENLSLATESLDAGETDLTAFLEVQRQRNAARLELIDRQQRLMSALFALQRAVGGSFETLPRPDITIVAERSP